MSKILKTYIFTGFGFDVLLRDVVIKEAHGDEYPDINMNELKLKTAKAVLSSSVKMTGSQIKFLRTFLKLSFDDVAKQIDTPASTIRSWENKKDEASGLSIEREKAFRMFVGHHILELERNKIDKDLILTVEFSSPKEAKALDVAAVMDYSFVSQA